MDNVRVVTFKEDYFSKVRAEKKLDPIYRKGETHAIHQKTVKQLQDKGAKMEVKRFDEQREIEIAKRALALQEKESKFRFN